MPRHSRGHSVARMTVPAIETHELHIAAGILISFAWLRGLDDILPGMSFHFPGPVALGVAIAAVVLGVIASILPACRAARLKVIEALTYE